MAERKTHIEPFKRTYPSGKEVWVGKSKKFPDGFDRRIPFSEYKLQQFEPISDKFAEKFIKERFNKTHPDAVNTSRTTFLKPNKLWQNKPDRYDVYGLDAPSIPILPKMPNGFGIPGQIVQIKAKYYVCANDGVFHEVYPPKHKDFGKFKEAGVKLVSTKKPEKFSYAWFVKEINAVKTEQSAHDFKDIIRKSLAEDFITTENARILLTLAEDQAFEQKLRAEKLEKKKPKKPKPTPEKYQKYTDTIKDQKLTRLTRVTHEIGYLKKVLATQRKYLSDKDIQYIESELQRRQKSKKTIKEDLDRRGHYAKAKTVYAEIPDKDFKNRTEKMRLHNIQLRQEIELLNEKRLSSKYSDAERGRAEYLYFEKNKQLKEQQNEVKNRQLFPKIRYMEKTEIAKAINNRERLPKRLVERMPKNLQNRYERMLSKDIKEKAKISKQTKAQIKKEKTKRLAIERAERTGKNKLLKTYETFYQKDDVTDDPEFIVQDLGEIKAVVMDRSRITALTTPELFKGSFMDKITSKNTIEITPKDLEKFIYIDEDLDEIVYEPASDSTYHKRFFDKPLKAMDKETLKIYTNSKENAPLIIRDKNFVFAVAPRYTEYDVSELEEEKIMVKENLIPKSWIKATPQIRQKIKDINKITKAKLVEKMPYRDKPFTLKKSSKKNLVYNELLFQLKPEFAKEKLPLIEN